MQTCSIDSLFDEPGELTALVATPAVARFVSRLPIRKYPGFDALPGNLDRLVVVGGGSLIDEAKLWKSSTAPGIELVAVPSIWGSGAEVSPVAVSNPGMHKDIKVDPDLVPDKACFWPELAESIPQDLALYACGDAWSHAIEGFLSPLAGDGLRSDLATIMQQMLELPLTNDARWFEPSAQACAGQARSSVGLVHGIAHTLENRLRLAHPDSGWGHARLCSVFLWPVMQFNQQHSDKWVKLSKQFGLDTSAISGVLQELFDGEAYNQALPLLEEYWTDILRDPCSRTNSCLVRPGSRTFFTERFAP